jgi:hypothetical protein
MVSALWKTAQCRVYELPRPISCFLGCLAFRCLRLSTMDEELVKLLPDVYHFAPTVALSVAYSLLLC